MSITGKLSEKCSGWWVSVSEVQWVSVSEVQWVKYGKGNGCMKWVRCIIGEVDEKSKSVKIMQISQKCTSSVIEKVRGVDKICKLCRSIKKYSLHSELQGLL